MNKWVKLDDVLNEIRKEVVLMSINNLFNGDEGIEINIRLEKRIKALLKNQSQSDTKGNPVLCRNCGHEHLSWITNDTKFHSLNVCSAYKCRCNKFERAVNN